MDLKDIGWQGMDCIHVAQDRGKWEILGDMVMNLLCSMDCGEFRDEFD